MLDPQPGEIILDVGCGSGELTNEIRNHILKKEQSRNNKATATKSAVYGMDLDPNMIERAKEQYFVDITNRHQIAFFQGDVCNFELPGVNGNKNSHRHKQVDAIFSNAALHWALDSETAVASMSRILKPGGRFVVEFGGKGNLQTIVEAANKVLSMHGKDVNNTNPWYFPSIGEYTSLLERHGIEVKNAVLFERPTTLEGGEKGLSAWFQMFAGPFINCITKDEEERIVNEILDILRPTLFNGSYWTADYCRIRIIGKKI
jgi:trans-aconitate 2-methyltransferase